MKRNRASKLAVTKAASVLSQSYFLSFDAVLGIMVFAKRN